MTTVSIIMASYNHGKFIGEAIQSVLNQSYKDFELIIIDDCSTDNTLDVINQFMDERIKLTVLPSNQGQFVATNIGLDQAHGKYIGILNSDDAFYKDKLKKQVYFLDSHPDIAAVFTHADIADESKSSERKYQLYHSIFDQKNRSRFQWLNYFFHYGNCLCHPSVLIRKNIHHDIGYYDPRFANCADLQYWIRLLSKYEIYILPEKLTKFRIHTNNDNMSGNSEPSQRRMHWEDYQAKLLYFNGLLSDDIFLKVFPETKKFMLKNQTKNITNYLLARIALEKNIVYFDALGLRILFEMMQDNKMAAQLKEIYNFNYKDLIQLTGKARPFQTKKIVKKCFENLRKYIHPIIHILRKFSYAK